MTRELKLHEIERMIFDSASDEGQQYWAGASTGVRDEITDTYYDRGLAAAVHMLDDLSRPIKKTDGICGRCGESTPYYGDAWCPNCRNAAWKSIR